MSSVDSTIAEGAAKLGKMGLAVSDIKALGITCQRETIVVWNKDTGKPVYNAISQNYLLATLNYNTDFLLMVNLSTYLFRD